MPYNVAIAGVLLANVLVLSVLGASAVDAAPALASIHLTTAVLIRQQVIVNAILNASCLVPRRLPLAVRGALANVYHLGGIHVGAALAAIAWSALALADAQPDAIGYVLQAAVVVVLGVMCALAAPPARRRWHDLFETSHRYGGWLAIVLIWAQQLWLCAARVVGGEAPMAVLAGSPAVWALALVTASVAVPWARLRRVRVSVWSPSPHVAYVETTGIMRAFPGSATAVARRPLGQWHSFADVTTPGEPGRMLVVSNAGDWTRELIAEHPTHLWFRGFPTAGVAAMSRVFRRVVWVATGSGIAPCLPHVLDPSRRSTLIWVTRSPEATYGGALVSRIRAARPEAIFWDTTTQGKPDLARLALAELDRTGAEAVFCISNQPTTWQVVRMVRAERVRAYGAIWDS